MGRRFSWLSRPERWHGGVALLLVLLLAGAILTLFRHHLTWYHGLAAWLVSINLTAFAYYGYDKFRARQSGGRVPEMVLHGLALLGGSLGAYLAMRLFRHKTVKSRFRLAFWCIVVLQLGLGCWAAWLVWKHHS
jgi:uncharacterized membrane protein YsdA (DUF1294 family)